MGEKTKKFLFLGFFVAIFAFCTFMLMEDTFAHPITDAIVTDYWDGEDNTYFDVSVSYDSANYTCSVTDTFHCIDAGYWYLRPSYSTTYSVKDEGSGNYEITIEYNGGWLGNNVQRARGTVHCDEKKRKLTAYAVTEFKAEGGKSYHKYLKTDGTVSEWLDSEHVPSNAYTEFTEVNKGAKAHVVVDNSKGNYEFGGWGSSCGDEPGETADNTNRKCTVNALNDDENVYAYYNAVSLFKGDSSVAEVSEDNKGIGWNDIPEDKKRYTNWQSESKFDTPTYVVDNCDSEKGCWVSFRHYLKRMSGTGSTEFSIERELGDDVVWTVHNFKATNSGENVAANPVKMYPGQKLCETLSFYAKSDSGANVKGDVVQTRICAAAVATLGADIDIQIRDQNSSDKYNEYGKSDVVYAKPTDTVNIKGVYSPKYQSLYNTVLPKGATVNDHKISSNNGATIGNVFSSYVNPAWNNAFSINLFYNENDLGKNCDDKSYYNGNVGSANQYDGITDYQVMYNDVGKIKKAKAVTNICEPVKNTPKQVSLTYSDSASFAAGVDVGDKRSKEVSVAVPYNFSNSTEIINAQDSVVYAGGTASIDYKIMVGAKNNSETNGEYATPVPGAEWGLSISYDGVTWDDVKLGGGDLNSGSEYRFEGREELQGGTKGDTINVPDLPAGTKIYFRSWVTPGDSGGSTNLNVTNFSGKVYSKVVRFVVAKKPSFQVWGGSIYSAEDVGLSMSAKNNLAGEVNYPYNITGGDKVRVFGSWAELSLVAEGEIKGLSSGAGLGYGMTADAGNASEKRAVETLGGRDSNDYCLMSTLSIENDNCKSYVGKLGRGSGGSGDKSNLIADFTEETGTNYSVIDFGSDNFVLREKVGELKDFSYEEINKNGDIRRSATKVIRTNGDVVIDDNITYRNDGYSNLESIPKIIIYAENINISCSVTRIDAVLIADEKINTCSGDITDNSSLRSTPLMIRGSVISNTLTLGRTYGAATGKNSVIPAEIINYDTSLYLWANNQSSATTSGKLTETYINELAPRY